MVSGHDHPHCGPPPPSFRDPGDPTSAPEWKVPCNRVSLKVIEFLSSKSRSSGTIPAMSPLRG